MGCTPPSTIPYPPSLPDETRAGRDERGLHPGRTNTHGHASRALPVPARLKGQSAALLSPH
eukprot:4073372-Prymnesium_polylepis.1